MSKRDVLIVGSGSLTRAVCYALATLPTLGTTAPTVTVVSRTASNAAEVCYIANVRAALSTSPARFRPLTVERYSAETLGPILREVSPRVVLNCASHQSPWEGTRTPSAWTALLHRRGFGFTLPLQSAIAVELSGAIATTGAGALFLNACFPDAVNPLLKSLHLPAHCGIGNVGLLAATLQTTLGLHNQAGFHVLGHHWHLHTPPRTQDEARVWLDGSPVPDVTRLLADQRAASRAELNIVTGHVAALVLDALLSGVEFLTSLPGVAGLPGGYPVRVRDGGIELRLPGTLRLEQAVALNQQWAALDGARISEDGTVSLSVDGAHQTGVAPEAEEIPDRFHATDLPEVCGRMLRLRSRLRRQATDSASPSQSQPPSNTKRSPAD